MAIKVLGFIRCSTGCTCCADQNHYIGPFTPEDAKRRFAYLVDGHGIVGSQYANNGHYKLKAVIVEEISGGRAIVSERVYTAEEARPKPVNPDGSPASSEERFCEDGGL